MLKPLVYKPEVIPSKEIIVLTSNELETKAITLAVVEEKPPPPKKEPKVQELEILPLDNGFYLFGNKKCFWKYRFQSGRRVYVDGKIFGQQIENAKDWDWGIE